MTIHTDNKETLQNALKRIEELKKENERLRTRCEQVRDEGTGYMQQLEQENAELKEHHKSVCETLTNTHRSLREQLTKAKEIIRHLLLLPYANNEEVFADVTSILDKAEQFIKDSEVEK